VDLIRTPELTYTTTTGSDGSYFFSKLGPGAYKLRASPPVSHTGNEVATYFPSALEPANAQAIVIQDDATVDGFQLTTAPVFRIRGTVREPDGKPASRVRVGLYAVTSQPVRVTLSFEPYFLATEEGQAPEPEEANVVTDDQGRFEFTSVRTGRWQLAASGGVATAVVAGENVEANIQLDTPFDLKGAPILWGVAQCHTPEPPNPRCPGGADSQIAPARVVYPLWLEAVDGQASELRLMMTAQDATFQLQGVRRGRYLIQTLPPFASSDLAGNAHLHDTFLGRITVNGAQVRVNQLVDMDRNSGPLEVNGGGHFDGDGSRPAFPIRPPGRVRGTVANGAGAVVVLVSRNAPIIGQLVVCDLAGNFETLRLPIGEYSVAAFRNLDFEGLRDPAILQKILSSNDVVRVLEDAIATVELGAPAAGY
jgi:hypothetical protein